MQFYGLCECAALTSTVLSFSGLGTLVGRHWFLLCLPGFQASWHGPAATSRGLPVAWPSEVSITRFTPHAHLYGENTNLPDTCLLVSGRVWCHVAVVSVNIARSG